MPSGATEIGNQRAAATLAQTVVELPEVGVAAGLAVIEATVIHKFEQVRVARFVRRRQS